MELAISYILNNYCALFADPVNLAVSKIAPALMAGNTVVVKPPTQARLCELALCRHNPHVLLDGVNCANFGTILHSCLSDNCALGWPRYVRNAAGSSCGVPHDPGVPQGRPSPRRTQPGDRYCLAL